MNYEDYYEMNYEEYYEMNKSRVCESRVGNLILINLY